MAGSDLAAPVNQGKRLDTELTEELVGARLDGMAALPRSVFLPRHLDGLGVVAIGARLGLSAENVERHLADALRVLTWGS